MVSMKDIRAVGRRIGKQFKPDKVILFGSYAYGKPTEDSDVDLLVIMPVKGEPEYKGVEIHQASGISFATDLLVRTPQEVRRRIRLGDFFMKEIIERGKVLYESSDRGMGGNSRRRLRQPEGHTSAT
jgi:predicted nucleotidyltransferase